MQYFGFALNLAQQLAYLFGEDELFSGGDVNEQTKGKLWSTFVLCLVETAQRLW